MINHNITIIQPDGSKTELDGDTYDLHLNTDADIKNALYLQHSFLWPVNIWKKHDLKQELNVEYDNKELSRIINSLTFMHKENKHIQRVQSQCIKMVHIGKKRRKGLYC